MKKFIKLLACIAAATVAFSCMEEANPETPVAGESTYDGPTVTLEFNVTKEDTKTAFDGENHDWVEGDQIKIIYTVDGKDYSTIGGIHWDDAWVIKADVAEDAEDTYYAVYPASSEYILEPKEGETELTFTARIPRNQDGSFENANLMAAKTTKNELAFAFKNLTHILKFNLAEGHGFKTLELCPNTETIITGRYFIDLTDDGVNMAYNSDGNTNSKYITITDLDSKSGTFYVGLVPDADMSTGIVLRGKKAIDKDYRYYAISKSPIETKRSGITNIKGNLNEYLKVNEYYITAKGTGDGSSWANAADISYLISLLNKVQLGTDDEGKAIYTKEMHQWRITNANIHIAAGVYNIPEANGNATFTPNGMTKWVDFKVIGGYPAEPSDGAAQDPEKNQTIFTTINKDNVRIIRFDNATFGNIVFDGITFKGLGETAVNSVGVGTYFSNSTAGTITYNNCKFTEFNNSNTSNNGAVIFANNSGELSLNFIGCEFSNNTTASNGIIALAKEKTTTTFTDCIFKSNTSTKNGGAIYSTAGTINFNGTLFTENAALSGGAIYHNGGTITIDNNCTFTSNSAENNYGGAIYVNGPEKGLTVKNSAFTSNTAKYGGAIANSIGTLTVDACSFTSNNATDQGGAIISFDAKLASAYAEIAAGKKASLYVYNSTFDQNIAKSQGAAIKAHGSGYLAVVNSTFSNNDCQNNSGGIIRLRNGSSTGVTAWIINSTSNNPNTTYEKNGETLSRVQHSITNQASTSHCYNSLLSSETTAGNGTVTKNFYGSIVGTSLYGKDGTSGETVTFAEQIEALVNGVFPVRASSKAETDGMSSTDLATLEEEIKAVMPDFDATKLTVDQKGNPRAGKTVMGAYVGE